MRKRRNLFEMNYTRIEMLLERRITDLKCGDTFHLKADGFMDLVCEVLPNCSETGGTVVSLAHYFEQEGDLCQDPEMTVRLVPPSEDGAGLAHGRADALTFQQAIPPIYIEVYPEPGYVNTRQHKEQNRFLGFWLNNLKMQGHKLIDSTKGEGVNMTQYTGIASIDEMLDKSEIRHDEFGNEVRTAFYWTDRCLFDQKLLNPWYIFDTDGDSDIFGVWTCKTRFCILTYSQGDIVFIQCPNAEAFDRELVSMCDFYGPVTTLVAMSDEGFRTRYFQDRSHLFIDQTKYPGTPRPDRY